jgi:hypothetical protein
MDWLVATMRLYGSVTRRAARVAVTNWPVGLSVFVYLAAMSITLPFAMMLGLLGGFIVGLVWAACIASFLFLVERLVRHGRVTLGELPASFTPYLSDVIGVMFVLWMARMLLSMALMTNPQGLLITLVAQLFIFVFFNAVPELIYLGHHSSLELLGESYQFISDNWIEWFPPTLLAGAILVVLMEMPLAGAAVVVKWALVGSFVYFVMVLRGFLFEELQGSTRRSRAFRYRSR